MPGHAQQSLAGIAGLALLAVLCMPPSVAASPVDVAVQADVIRLPVEPAQGLRFHRLSTADGLSQTRVAQIIQDDVGFIWFGTQYGLNRYDGYDFKLFVHEPGNEGSAAGSWVTSLFKDRDGMIWVGWSKGLDRFDPRTEAFTHYAVEPDGSSERTNAVLHISQDREGKLWLATGSGIHRLDPETGAVIHHRRGDEPDDLPTNDVNWSGEDSRGRFWVGTSRGLSEFDRASGKVLRHLNLPDPVQVSLFEDRSGSFWVTQASGNGLALYDPDTNTLTPYSFYDRDPEASTLTGVMGIAEDDDGNLWLGSPGLGLLQLNRERSGFRHYGHQPHDAHSIAEDKVIALFQDRDGNIWTGLHSSGVNFFGTGAQRFEVFRHIPGDPNSLTLDFVNAIFEDRDGILWIGNDDGLNRIDRKTGRRELIDIGLGVKPMVISLAQDDRGAIWIGTFAHGLTRYDPLTRHYETYVHDDANPRSLSHNEVHRVLVDRAGIVWVATDDGLDRFDPATRDFTIYKLDPDSRYSQSYASIAEDSKGNLWLGTVYSGLHHFDRETERITVYRHDPADYNGLRDDTVPTVYLSRQGTLWIGTQNGLNRLDLDTGTMHAYDVRDGLPANSIACILEDEQGNIWMSTTRGLSKLTPDTGTFANYALEGLPGNDLTGWSTCSMSRRGELFFAGFSGAVGFFSTGFEEAPLTAPLVLTGFEVEGAEAGIGPGQPLSRAPAFSDRVVLQHDERTFSATFAGLRYTSPETTRYRYRLDGLDDAWRETPSSLRTATYTTLPAGRYTFRVQMAADRGDWQQPGNVLDVLILPPWWATWWSRTALLLLFIVLSWLLVRARVNHVAQKVTLQMEARNRERMRIAQDLHDTLLQGLLSASLQLSVAQDQLPPAAKARPLLEHVTNLLRQLVVEGRNTVRGLRTWQFDTEDLECAISAVPSDLQMQSSARFHVVVEGTPQPLLSAARAEVYLIAREAISNSLRHANATTIEVSLEYLPTSFRLTVRDNGRGFVADEMLSSGATHFGLAVMSERADRLGAVIELSSGTEAGTEIVLSVPRRAIYVPGATRSS